MLWELQQQHQQKIQRPISLINVDSKMASEALAKRLEHILPDLIRYNQNAYLKVRSLLNTVRSIDDGLNKTKRAV